MSLSNFTSFFKTPSRSAAYAPKAILEIVEIVVLEVYSVDNQLEQLVELLALRFFAYSFLLIGF